MEFAWVAGKEMIEYCAAIWRCRYFWLSLVRNDLRTRYRRSVLGIGWSLLHPLVMTAVLCLVFPLMLHVEVRIYAPFVLPGLVLWNYLVSVTIQGCQCLFQGEAYIRQYPAPMAIYPLRAALAGTIHFLIALPVILALAWWSRGLSNPMALLSLIPTVALLFILVWATATLAAVGNVFFPDTLHLCEDGFQMLFFITPVMYDAATLRAAHLQQLLSYNPLVFLLQLVREPVLDGHAPSLTTFGASAALVFVVAGLSVVTLASVQKKLIFHL